MKTKLAAFTMVELLVVMVLAGFIFSAALLVVDLMNRQTVHQARTHEAVWTASQLRVLLQRDAQAARSIRVEGPDVYFEGGPVAVHYRLDERHIGRTAEVWPRRTDTFHLPTLHWTARWQAEPVQVGRIDALEIESRFFDRPFNLKLSKAYDHRTLLDDQMSTK